MTDPTAIPWFGQGLPLINVSAQAKDVLALTAPVAGTYSVTLMLEIDGTLTPTATAGQVIANSSVSFGLLVGGLNDTDANIYQTPGAFNDVLTVTKNVTFAQDGATVQMDFDTFISFNAFAVPANTTVAGDLSNTASLTLVLPSAVTLTGSESGTFGVPPEPSTYGCSRDSHSSCWSPRNGSRRPSGLPARFVHISSRSFPTPSRSSPPSPSRL